MREGAGGEGAGEAEEDVFRCVSEGEESAQVNVWLVWTESGEYEQYERSLRGVFEDEGVARRFAKAVGSEVQPSGVLTEMPTEVTLYEWSDCVTSEGEVSPDHLNLKRLGHERTHRTEWTHEAEPDSACIDDWDRRGGLHIKVVGRNREWVRGEYERLLAEAKERVKAKSRRKA